MRHPVLNVVPDSFACPRLRQLRIPERPKNLRDTDDDDLRIISDDGQRTARRAGA